MVQVSAVNLSLKGKSLFRDLEFCVQKGESFGILGPSGAGKTVLLKMLAGLFRPDSGTLNVQSNSTQMAFQRGGLFDFLNVEENLEFALRETKGRKDPERVHSLLEEVGLGHAAKLSVHELSGGMQKRLGIARALIVEPDLLLLDDPTAGLDPITSREISNLLIELREEQGFTLILTTSEIPVAKRLCRRIGFLWNGKLVEDQTDPGFHQFIRGDLSGPLEVEA